MVFRLIFGGMLAASLDNAIADHMDPVHWPDPSSTNTHSSSGDRASLRADLGQSRSGNSSLSPRAYRARSTIAELAVWEIGPSTSVRAPRNYAGRSPQGREDNLRKVAGQIGGLRGSRSRRGQSSLYYTSNYIMIL